MNVSAVNKCSQSKVTLGSLVLLGLMIFTQSVMAFSAPDTAGFGYDVYDFIVNKVLNGPIGSLIGVFVIIGGFVMAFKNNWIGAVLLIMIGIAVLKAEALSQSLGYTIPMM